MGRKRRWEDDNESDRKETQTDGVHGIYMAEDRVT